MADKDDDAAAMARAVKPLRDYQRHTIKQMNRVANERAGFAEFMFDALKVQVAQFEATLKPTEEVCALLASFGATMLIVITTIGFRRPHLILLRGIDEDGKEVELLQHVSQVNLLLKTKQLKPGSTRRTIGFDLEPVPLSKES